MSDFVWGTVTALSPFRVRLDGDTTELPFAPDSLVTAQALTVTDRVRVELAGTRIIVHGRNGGDGPSTRTVTYTTSSLANNASETGTLDLGVGFTILHFLSSFACRFRAYQSLAQMSPDAARVVGVYPTGDHGLIFEDDGSAAGDYSTVAVGGLLNSETLCPIAITNRSGATRALTVTLIVRS